MVVDDAVDDRETEASPLSPLLGGVKGLKDVGLDSLADAGAGIADANKNVALGRHRAKRLAQLIPGGDASGDRNRAVVRHGVTRVDAKVKEHLVDLASIRFGQRQTRLELEAEVDRLGKSRAEHALEFLSEHI